MDKEEKSNLAADKLFNRYALIIYISQVILAGILAIIGREILTLLFFIIELLLLIVERRSSKNKFSGARKVQRDANFIWLMVLIEIGIIFLLEPKHESTWLLFSKLVFILQIIFLLWGGLGIYVYQLLKNKD